MHFLSGLLLGALGLLVYDLSSGYPASDFLKDLYHRLSGKAKSFAQAKLNRLSNKMEQVKKAL